MKIGVSRAQAQLGKVEKSKTTMSHSVILGSIDQGCTHCSLRVGATLLSHGHTNTHRAICADSSGRRAPFSSHFNIHLLVSQYQLMIPSNEISILLSITRQPIMFVNLVSFKIMAGALLLLTSFATFTH